MKFSEFHTWNFNNYNSDKGDIRTWGTCWRHCCSERTNGYPRYQWSGDIFWWLRYGFIKWFLNKPSNKDDTVTTPFIPTPLVTCRYRFRMPYVRAIKRLEQQCPTDTSREVSDTVHRSPLIGQQGGRRPNTRLSLADHLEYLNLKNDTVAHICAQ